MSRRADPQVLCGYHAVHAALRMRPDQVLRLLFAEQRAAELAPVLRQLARRRAVYRLVPDEELSKAAASHAHQGLVAVVQPRHIPSLDRPALQQLALGPGVVVALDNVTNPHNLGAIARTAAFLGVRALLLEPAAAKLTLSTGACRTAEGALEVLPVVQVADLTKMLREFAAGGGQALALALDGALQLRQVKLAGRGLCLVAGAEEHGVRPAVRAACHGAVRIAGSDAVQSLNVGVAVGIALAHFSASQ